VTLCNIVENSAIKIVYCEAGSITLVQCFVKGNFAIPDIPANDHYQVLWAEPSTVIALKDNLFEDVRSSIISQRVSDGSGNSYGVVDLHTAELEHINTIVCFADIIPSDSFTPSTPFSNSAVCSSSHQFFHSEAVFRLLHHPPVRA
jgi:hypothetical protein